VAGRSRDVTEAELAVLQVLWEHGERTVREITDRLYPEGGNSETATVQKLCERLEAKGCVAADRRRRPKRYRARVDRESLSARKLRAVAVDLYAGALIPLVSQLLRDGPFSREEIEQLRAEVERLAGEGDEGSDAAPPRRRGGRR
jgi:predicted transcriptional regulator